MYVSYRHMSETNMLVWYGYACLVYKYAAWNYTELPYIPLNALKRLYLLRLQAL